MLMHNYGCIINNYYASIGRIVYTFDKDSISFSFKIINIFPKKKLKKKKNSGGQFLILFRL